ncbi:MAG: cyclic nucleotide-binding domain-containing protein [Candidatus Eremiobacteraeota bacterium]|nr:cyclic nucleotide-binding domain-containing protein [Candidatus Eremiobacteraeota bacterium]
MSEVLNIAPGCVVVRCVQGDIMFGSPSDIIKVFIKKQIPVPSAVVLPSSFFKYGLNQASVEFPLYYHIFVKKDPEKGKFTLIGDHDALERQHRILRQTLMGPSEEQMRAWGIDERIIRHTIDYHNYFQSDIPSIESLVDAIHFEDHIALYRGVHIRRLSEAIFEISCGEEKADVDITVKNRPAPYVSFPPINQPIKPMKLGFINVGSYSGFDPTGDTTSLIIFAHYLGISIDGSPWLRERLQSLGISMDHIQVFVITHLHDDHANILDMLLNDKKVSIMTSRLIYRSFLVKASCILDIPEEEVDKLINFIELMPGEPRRWFGIEFVAHEAVHPVPTIGVKIEKKILISGDTLWGKELDKAYEAGIIDQKTYRVQQGIPLDAEASVIFMDAGGGEVHPDLRDLASLPEEQKMKLVVTHTSNIDGNLQDLHLQTSWFGNYRILEQETLISPIDALSIIHSPLLEGAHPNWVKVFMSRGSIKQYGPNQIIFAEGTAGKSFHIILNGTVRVVKGNQLITYAQAGEFFGEISSPGSETRHSSSIITISPVELLEIDSGLFHEFLHDEGLRERFQKLGEIRPILFQTTVFKNIPERILKKIIDTTFVSEFPPGTSIVKQGDPADAFYLILEGTCEVIMEVDGMPREIGTLNANDVFGEIGLLEEVRRTASINALTPVKALVLKKQDFEEIVQKVPGITYQLLLQARKRRTSDEKRSF